MTAPPRLAELVAALSLATDLGMGQPMEQGLRSCLVSLALAEEAGLSAEQQSEIYYVALLRFLGCTADAHDAALAAGGDDIALRRAIAPVLGAPPRELLGGILPAVGPGLPVARRALLVGQMVVRGKAHARAGVRAHCEAAELLATRLGLPDRVRAGLAAAFEQWDGGGLPEGLAGEQIPLSARLVTLARDVEVLHRLGGADLVRTALAGRTCYDPDLARLANEHLDDLVAAATRDAPWEAVLLEEPQPHAVVPDVDEALEVLADFTDLKSPYFAGHSRAVAALAAAADPNHAELLRRAGLVQDLGRVAVPSGIWWQPEPLTAWASEAVRLHPYYTERILARSPLTASLARIASLHHEHLDGSGYHRGVRAAEIPYTARVLAVADAWRTLTSARPRRPALTPAAAARHLRGQAGTGKLDPDAVDAVVAAAHEQPVHHSAGPAALSRREVEVLRLLCTGATKKDIAAALTISARTADHHVRHIYAKLDVHSRAAATLYAAEHGLV